MVGVGSEQWGQVVYQDSDQSGQGVTAQVLLHVRAAAGFCGGYGGASSGGPSPMCRQGGLMGRFLSEEEFT